MKKVLTIGRDTKVIDALLTQEGLILVADDPEVVVSFGGDGYLLDAERLYPGVPKLPIRHDSICNSCIDHDTTNAIKALAEGTIPKCHVHKLETTINGQTYTAVNEFSFHHVRPNQAIRFTVQINDEPHIESAIGDGLIVATPFGSHAYYRSITQSTFRLGIGIAYNNTTESLNHLVVRDTDSVTVAITRGPAYFLIDNDQTMPILETGQSVVISQSKSVITLLGLERFRCPDCDQPIIPKAVQS